MPALVVFEDPVVPHLRPLVDTRAVFDLRVGARTMLQAIRDAFLEEDLDEDALTLHARPLVADLTALRHTEASVTPSSVPSGGVLFVNGRWLAFDGPATERVRRATSEPRTPRVFTADTPDGEVAVAAWLPDAASRLPRNAFDADALAPDLFDDLPREELNLNADDEPSVLVGRVGDVFDALSGALRQDYAHLKGLHRLLKDIHDRTGATVHPSALAVNHADVYLAPGATIKAGAILNAEDGPIYVAEDATVFERAVVKGPCYVGPKSQVKVGADVAGTTIGYYCKVGGEVHDAVFHSLSNKGHAGFLGHSYLGRWCNLGADTNTSNLKNDYGEVTLYDFADAEFAQTGRQFLGLVMGDHAKCGINTMFNTGTVVGVSCNVYGSNFPPRVLPAFSWGSPDDGFVDYRLGKAAEVAARVMARRDRPFTDVHRSHFETLFTQTAPERDALLD